MWEAGARGRGPEADDPTATVLGAGVMGSQIAAHLANAGVPVLLLDVTPQAAREGSTRRAPEAGSVLHPEPHTVITTGGFDDGPREGVAADWIIEAIVERLDVKRGCSSASSAPPRRRDRQHEHVGHSDRRDRRGAERRFRRHFSARTSSTRRATCSCSRSSRPPTPIPTVVDTIARFADRRLGKGVVIAKDTPNFIANRIGLFGVARVFEALQDGVTIEEIDAITGPALGRPKSATFRTMDLAGVDVLGHVARNLAGAAVGGAARSRAFRLPPFVEDMIEARLDGRQGRPGVLQESQECPNADAETRRDPHARSSTMEYRAQTIRAVPVTRCGEVDRGPGRTDSSAVSRQGPRRGLPPTHARPHARVDARVAPHIAHLREDVDRAMRWGFGWEIGPFETMRALGLHEAASA